MTIICSVSAEFENPEGGKFIVTGKERGVIKQAPDWIANTLLFKWLVKDGSIKFVTKSNRITAENDPLAGLNAEGKAIVDEKPEEQEDPTEALTEALEETPKAEKPKRRPRKKKDDAE